MKLLEYRLFKMKNLAIVFKELEENNMRFVDADEEFLKNYLNQQELEELYDLIIDFGLHKILKSGLSFKDSFNKKISAQKINKVIKTIRSANQEYEDGFFEKHLNNEEINYLYQRLLLIGKKEIFTLYLMRSKENKKIKKVDENKLWDSVNIYWRKTDPYSILCLEVRNYGADELLIALKRKVAWIQEHFIDKDQIREEIDLALDAYNELINKSNDKTDIIKR